MVKIGKFDKVELSGLIVLFVGVILLAFTFFSAYMFLIGRLNILGSQDLVAVFGNALGPLIEAIIRILYLGIMGWVGSILTIRAVQLLKKEKEAALTQSQVKSETKQSVSPTAAKVEPKQEVKESKEVESQEKTPVQEQSKETEKEAAPAQLPTPTKAEVEAPSKPETKVEEKEKPETEKQRNIEEPKISTETSVPPVSTH